MAWGSGPIKAKEVAQLMGVCVLLLGAWLLYDLWQYRLWIEPRSGAQTLTRFSVAMPSPQLLQVRREETGDVLLWWGPIPFGVVNSGAPLYVFSADGSLIFWTGDSGDDHVPSVNHFRSLPLVRKVSLQEALDWTNRNQPQPEDRQ